ncbi:MAG: RDD family protein [Prosthecobacter sp.]|uniref:RDD family protein n=1 Tax=Prosthecobacter sp. TaxID=1965333 RepID=UPI00262E88FF|nr:RDD family protein [Prosthecobacter sp.]MCF7788777.1 RDD family protein [Prosthecobacter sp.]
MTDPINPYAPPQSNILPAGNPDDIQQLASPWRRLGASILDSLIMMVVVLPIMWFSGYFTRIMEQAGRAGSWNMEQLLWAVVGLVVLIAINWNHLGRGQTIGKGIMDLRIVRKNGTPADRSQIILKRILPLQLIAQVPFLGAIFAFVDALLIFRAKHNTIHDDIADTKVIDLRQLPAV